MSYVPPDFNPNDPYYEANDFSRDDGGVQGNWLDNSQVVIERHDTQITNESWTRQYDESDLDNAINQDTGGL